MRRLAAGALAALLLTGCGTTVQYRGAAQSGDGLSATTGGAQPQGGAVAPGTTGAALGGPVPAPGGAGGSTGAASGTSGSAPGQGSSPEGMLQGAESGRGFTRTTISIGVGTASDYNATAGNLGLSGVGYQGDPNVWLKAVVDDINKRGGLVGRKIVLVKHDYNTAQLLADPAAANQAACATFTQDHPVFAVLLAGMIVEDTILSCLGQAGVPLIYPGASLDYPLHYQASYNRFPLFFNVAQMVGEQLDHVGIDRLFARGFFQPWNTTTGQPGTAAANPTRIGILGFDDNDGKLQLASRTAELARHGLKPDVVVSCPRGLTAGVQCAQSAELQFAANRVTHIFGASTVFMNSADSQGYHPRYYVAVEPSAYAENEKASQLNGAMSESYVPLYDVEPSEAPKDSPAAARCKALMRAVGAASSDRATLALQLSVCDEFFFTEAALKGARVLSGPSLRVGMEHLGSTMQSALAFQTFLGPHDHASAPSLRDLAYDSKLGRFVYASTTDYHD